METKHKRALMVLGVIVAVAVILYLYLSSRGVVVFRDGNPLPSLSGAIGLPQREPNSISYNMPAYDPPPFPGSLEGGAVQTYGGSSGGGCCKCLSAGGAGIMSGDTLASQYYTGIITPYGGGF